MPRLVLALLLSLAWPGLTGPWPGLGQRSPPAPLVREVRLLMGSTAEVAAPERAAPEAIAAAFAALEQVDDEMSIWKESALTRLNASGRAAVTPALLTVIRHALDVAEASGGAFDPTVEPLVRAAGALGDRRRRVGSAERRRLLRRIGARHVRLEAGSVVRLDRGARLDLGGIAKGYALDRAIDRLRAAGLDDALVDLGQSSVGVLGTRSFLVRDPFARDSAPLAELVVADACLGTSGSDQRGAHVIDPRDGRPVARRGSVTVIATTAMEADALSTAAWVLGPQQGLALLALRGAHGLFVTGERGAVMLLTTPGFADRFSLVAAPGVQVSEGAGYFSAASAAS